MTAHIFDYSTEVEEKERANDGYLGHANRTSFLVSEVQSMDFKEKTVTTYAACSLSIPMMDISSHYTA
jgi:hypothetical protein